MVTWDELKTMRKRLRLRLLKQIYDGYFNGGNGTVLYQDKLDAESKLVCQYLADKALIELETVGGLQPSYKCRITVAGIDYVESSDLVQ